MVLKTGPNRHTTILLLNPSQCPDPDFFLFLVPKPFLPPRPSPPRFFPFPFPVPRNPSFFPVTTSPPRLFPFSGAPQNPSFFLTLRCQNPSFYLSLPYPNFFPFLSGAPTQIFDIFRCLKTLPFWLPKFLTFFIFLFDIFLPFWPPFPIFYFLFFLLHQHYYLFYFIFIIFLLHDF